jgi:hypothetical protein
LGFTTGVFTKGIEMKKKVFLGLVASFFVVGAAQASWLSEITGIHIDANRGQVSIERPRLEAIPEMLQKLPKDVGQALLNPAAPYVATAIKFSRGQALNRGVQPIPQNIRNDLQRYFPAEILNKVRWTTAGGISLDGALKNWFNQEGAITLDEVIVFSNSDQAQNDVELWAHELTHVLQYSQLGVETFAFHYSVNWNSFESQARDNASNIIASINSTRQGQDRTYGYQGQPVAAAQRPTWAAMNRAARQAIPPGQCIWINNSNNTTGNSCPVRVTVTDAIVQRLSDGYTFTIPCNQPTCTYQPNQSGPLLSPPGHSIVGNNTAYAW